MVSNHLEQNKHGDGVMIVCFKSMHLSGLSTNVEDSFTDTNVGKPRGVQ